MAGLYIHVPFCKQPCYYCDFHFSTNRSLQAEICQAISDEMILQKDYLTGEPLETIYFGGGTPSILKEKELELVFDSIKNNFSILEDAEITVEANPDDLSLEKIKALTRLSVNRLSIGVQSFDNTILKFLNRSHNATQAEEAIKKVRDAGFHNINVDLMYAIPGRDSESLSRDLEKFLALQPEHISAYSLTVEEKTVFGKWSSTNKFKAAPEEENAFQFELIMDTLSRAGYDQYEISNYARPSFISQHNSNYWRQKKYLGVGPSAHSFDGQSRQANVSNNHTYLNSIRKQTVPATKEWLTREDHINEYLMTSLRTVWGCDLQYLLTQYQYNLLEQQATSINNCVDKHFMLVEGNKIILTRSGKMQADKISSDLFLIA